MRLQVPPVFGLTFFCWFNRFKVNLPCGTFIFMATNSPHKLASVADFGYCNLGFVTTSDFPSTCKIITKHLTALKKEGKVL